jgi:ParB family chromosome partitioning protein
MSSNKRNALGRGLTALLENSDTDITSINSRGGVGSISQISISHIEANPFQPRTDFEETALKELSESIKVHGVIQPITVRKMGYDKYQIISGERRVRASILAGLASIPAYIRVANDQEMLEMALIENIQRENLNAIEVALSYKRLLEECNIIQEELGDRVGKDRSTVNNYLRLLKLPAEIQAGVRDATISMGHARALVNIENLNDQLDIYNETIRHALSVRKVEELVKLLQVNTANAKSGKGKPAKGSKADLSDFKGLEKQLSEKFNTRIAFKAKGNGRGEIVIPFKSKDELQRLSELLGQ